MSEDHLLSIAVHGSVTFAADEWNRFEMAAQESGMSVVDYLRNEPNHWWQWWADSVDDIDIDEVT